MDKRYQVFISSTFIDLKDERQAVLRGVLELTREDRDQGACPPYEQAGHCWLGLKIR
jgi:hypothetical protein